LTPPFEHHVLQPGVHDNTTSDIHLVLQNENFTIIKLTEGMQHIFHVIFARGVARKAANKISRLLWRLFASYSNTVKRFSLAPALAHM